MDASSPLKFLYFIKNVILDSILESELLVAHPIPFNVIFKSQNWVEDWKTSFEELDGLKHIYGIFLSHNFSSDWSVFVYLMRTMNKWLLGEYTVNIFCLYPAGSEEEIRSITGTKSSVTKFVTSGKFTGKLDISALIRRLMVVMTEAASRDLDACDAVAENCASLLSSVLISHPGETY